MKVSCQIPEFTFPTQWSTNRSNRKITFTESGAAKCSFHFFLLIEKKIACTHKEKYWGNFSTENPAFSIQKSGLFYEEILEQLQEQDYPSLVHLPYLSSSRMSIVEPWSSRICQCISFSQENSSVHLKHRMVFQYSERKRWNTAALPAALLAAWSITKGPC